VTAEGMAMMDIASDKIIVIGFTADLPVFT
jgi:hypothetical protein